MKHKISRVSSRDNAVRFWRPYFNFLPSL